VGESETQLAESGSLELVDPRYADTENFGNFGQVQFFHEVQLDDQLQPLGQLGDLLGEPSSILLLEQDPFGVSFGSGEQRRAVRIAFLHRVEVDCRAIAAELLELGKRQTQRGGSLR